MHHPTEFEKVSKKDIFSSSVTVNEQQLKEKNG